MKYQIDAVTCDGTSNNPDDVLNNAHNRKYIDVVAFQRKYDLMLHQANDILRRALSIEGYKYPEDADSKCKSATMILLEYDPDKGNFARLCNSTYDRDQDFFKFTRQVVPSLSITAHVMLDVLPREGHIALDGKNYEVNALLKALKMIDEGLISG